MIQKQKKISAFELFDFTGQAVGRTSQGGVALAPSVDDQNMAASLREQGYEKLSVSKIMVDTQAVASTTSSLYETLQRCEDERVKLTTLVKNAQRVGRQQDQSAIGSSQGAMAIDQTAQVPVLDAWISGRLSELHAVDDALGQRQKKLEKLEASLSNIAHGLSSQIQQLNQAKADLQGEYDSIDARLAGANERINQQVTVMEQVQAQAEANLTRIQATGESALASVNREFQTLAQTIVGRLESVRKPVHRWLEQHLTQYEAMLNERIQQAHLPVAKRIEGIQAEIAQAIAPMDQYLTNHQEQMTAKVQEFGQRVSESLEQQVRDIQQAAIHRIEQLDQHVAGLLEPAQAQFEARRQKLIDEAGKMAEQLDQQWKFQRLAVQERVAEQVEAFAQQLVCQLDPAEYQVTRKITTLKARHEHKISDILAGYEARVTQALDRLDQQMNLGLENLGGKAETVGQWFESRRKTMSTQMEELQFEAMAALEQAQRIIEHGRQSLTPAGTGQTSTPRK